MTDNRTTELHGIIDEFEHECFMLRVEASETRARDDVVRKSYESIRDEFAGRIVALVSDREAELQSALNKAAGNWAKADAELREKEGEMTDEAMEEHGWFTREDVEGAFVSGYSLGSMPIGSDPRWNENEQTVDEHMAELGWVRERTCRLVGTLYYDGYDVWYHELSCGHEVETLDKEPPSYCPDCGAEVMDA